MTLLGTKIIDRYLVREVLNPFAFGVGIFTVFVFALDPLIKIIELLRAPGTSSSQVLLLALLRIPEALVLTFPMAMLMGSLWAFGELSGRGEITAASAAGVSLRRLMTPLLIFAFAVSLFTIVFHEYVVVWCVDRAEGLQDRLLPLGVGRLQRQILFIDTDPRTQRPLMLVYARGFDPTAPALVDITLVRFGEEKTSASDMPAPLYVTRARSAQYRGNGLWQLTDAYTQERFSDFPMYWRQTEIRIERRPRDIERIGADPRRLSMAELLRVQREMYRDPFREEGSLHRLQTEFQNRLAIPFASFIFALIAAPLAIRPNQRQSRSMALGLSVLIILIYYIIARYCTVLGEEGVIHPAVAAWAANVITAVPAWILLSRTTL